MKHSIAIEALSFSHSKRAVLHHISCRIKPGSVTALVGPNGAGKSTLLRCIAGIFPSPEGSISISDLPLSAYSRSQLAGLIGYLPQRFTLPPSQTVREFILMSRYFRIPRFSAPSPGDLQHVREALTLTDTSNLADRMLGELSGGEQQRVLWASTIAQDAPILLLDEPFNALDPHFQDRMIGVLHRLQDECECSVLVATHDINLAAMAAQQILALKDGHISFFGGRDEFMTGDNLEDIYGKNFCRVKHPTHNSIMILPG